MTKSKAIFVCQDCGHEAARWMGRCPACSAWNTLVEETRAKADAKVGAAASRLSAGSTPVPLAQAQIQDEPRFLSGMPEFDRVLGGGVVPGSLVLVGGDPGIGKSTLLLQVAQGLAAREKVLYVSGEESVQQVRLRAERLGVRSENVFLATETDVNLIESFLDKVAPRAVVVDSIQTIFHPDLPAAPGSVSQVRECAAQLLRLAKSRDIAIFLVGHVTKTGEIAGPRVLEHVVDTVLYFEGERHTTYRVLRAVKNRFGSTHEVGIFEMRDRGLVEVLNPSELFIAERPSGASGSVVVPLLEGTRPLLVEIQALVGSANFMGNPRRLATGVDYNRVSIILAVLEKRSGLALGSQDVYVNVAGGVRVEEPAADLGLAVAVASSLRNVPVDPRVVVLGEVGLAGEVRGVARVDHRIAEAAKLGFTAGVVPRANLKGLDTPPGFRIIGVDEVGAALEYTTAR